jgi:hypothetical protein
MTRGGGKVTGVGRARSVERDISPVPRVDEPLEVPRVGSDNHGAVAQRLSDDQRVGFEPLGCSAASTRLAGTRPKLRSSSPVRGRHRRVFELAAELVEAGKASPRPDMEELAPEFVVRNLGHQQLMSLGGLDRPGSRIGEFARMADLAEHRGVEQKPHVRLADESSGTSAPASGSSNRAMSLGFHSGSSWTSSFAQRWNIASTRAARSSRIRSGSERGFFAGRATSRRYQSSRVVPVKTVIPRVRAGHVEVSTMSVSILRSSFTGTPLLISPCSEVYSPATARQDGQIEELQAAISKKRELRLRTCHPRTSNGCWERPLSQAVRTTLENGLPDLRNRGR